MELSFISFLSAFCVLLISAVINLYYHGVKSPENVLPISLTVKQNEIRFFQYISGRSPRRILLYIFILILAFCGEILSQSCANYAPVTRTIGITYNSIAGSNPSYFIWRNTASNQNDDNRSYPVPIGFDFWYLGVRYTHITGSLNGTLDFSTSTSDGNNGGTGPYGPNYNNLFSTANMTMLALAPLYADIWTANAGTVPIAVSMVYQVSGTAPNRVLTVEWINFDEWNTPVNNPPASVNMQVKIYETTGAIEFIYGIMTAGASGGGSYPLRYTCGINSTWSVGAPDVTQLLTQQVANTATFSNVPQNALTTLPASDSKLCFTPPVPTAAPTGLSFTGVAQSGMTLNWTDNATNEVGYAIYNSTDDVNFSFVTQAASGSSNATVTNLSSGTTYYWKVYAVTDGALSSPLAGNQATLPAGTFISIQTGSWHDAATWDIGSVPTAGDNVIIANSTTVTLNGDATCQSLTVGQGVSGQLIIGNDAASRTLSVNNDIYINSGGAVITGSTAATHTMIIGGNLSNDGTLDLAPTGARVCNVTFNKNGDQTISGTGTTTRFNRVTLNMGASGMNVLEVISSNFTAAANFLSPVNGIFKLSAAANVTPFTGNVTISSTGGIWLNNTLATMNTTGGTITLYGLLRATAGTMNIGNAVNNNLISYGGTVAIDGGTMQVAGRFDRAGPSILTHFTISSGTLTVANIGSTIAGAPPFRIDEVGSTFNMTGGIIIIARPGAGNLGYLNTGGTVGIVSGGTLQIGDASTPPSQTIQINSVIAVPNLVIGSGISVTAQLATNSLAVNKDITIDAGILDANGLNISLGGAWTNNGTFVDGAGTITLNGSSIQSVGGSASSTFNNLTINNASGITIAKTATVNGLLTFNSGVIATGPDTLILGSAGDVTRTSGHVYGNFRKFAAVGAASVLFETGDSVNYTPVYLQFGNISTGGNLLVKSVPSDHPDIASSVIEGTKDVNRYWLLAGNGIVYDTCNATFNFVPGDTDPGTDPDEFIVQQYISPSWLTPAAGTRTASSTQAKGLTAFGDFAIGNIKTFTITATSNPNGQISPSGQVTVDYNTDQSFTITPDIGYHIDSLFVDGLYTDSTTSYTFKNVTADHAIHSKFAIDTYTITASAGAGGNISPFGPVTVNHGSDQAFMVTPNTGYHIDSMFVDGVHTDSTTSYTFRNVTAHHTIHIAFAINVYTITAGKIGNGTITPSGTVNVTFGEDKTFNISPDAGYHLDSLFVDDGYVDSTASYTFKNVTGNHTILAKFSINLFVITATAENGGSIIPSGNVIVSCGSCQNFLILPNSGYHCDSLFVDGIHVDSTHSYTFDAVNANHTIGAKFAINSYIITATSGPNGSIIPSGAVSVNEGSDQRFTFTPVPGYHTDSLFVDGAYADSASGYTFSNVSVDHTIHVTFAINRYTITATAGTGGIINPPGVIYVYHGGTSRFTFVPDTGYFFDSLFVDGVYVDSTVSYTFNNVIANHTIFAKFIIKRFTITATAGPNGSITPSGPIQVNYGDSLLLRIKPFNGYIVDSISIDGSYAGDDTVYIFTNVTEDHTINVTFKFVVGVADTLSGIPKEYALHQNFPNPFNPSTTLRYSLPTESMVKLTIYNMLGEVVKILADGIESAGYCSVEWNAENYPSGIYFYRIEIFSISESNKSFISVKKMLLIK